MAQGKRRLSPHERRMRRRRRFALVMLYVIIAFGLAWFFESQATTTVLFVRHADVNGALDLAGDPPLNAAGRARAELLADFLVDIDVVAGVDAIYADGTARAEQTALPLARRLGLDIGAAAPYEVAPFMNEVLSEHKGEIVLVVTDRDAIAPLIDELHGSKNVPEIEPDEYDNFYIVTIPWGEGRKVKTLRLRYALGWEPPEPASDLRRSHGSSAGVVTP